MLIRNFEINQCRDELSLPSSCHVKPIKQIVFKPIELQGLPYDMVVYGVMDQSNICHVCQAG